MNQPNVFIAGFAKSGTSSLFDYLAQHKDVFSSFRKEPHIYAIESRYVDRKNPSGSHSFEKFYAGASDQKYILDASTTTLIADLALERIKKDCPNAKVIIIARDPIERILSHYNWIRSLGIETLGFRKEMEKWSKIPFDPQKDINGNYKNYIEFSKYGVQIERCFNIFPQDQVLILYFEDLKTEPEKLMTKVFEFLEIEKIELKYEVKNSTKKDVYIKKRGSKLFNRTMDYLEYKHSAIYKRLPSFLLEERIEPYEPSKKELIILYNFLKEDLELLESIGYLSNKWKTVNSIRK